MKSRAIVLIIVLILSNISRAQQDSTINIRPLDVKIGVGFGNKSHFGNLGVTSSLFLMKYLSLNVSGGFGAFNCGGLVGSIGGEVPFLYFKKSYLSLGGAWTYIGEGFDLFGDDDSSEYVTYRSSYMKNLQFYLGYSSKLKSGVIFTVELGYSHALTDYQYTFGGPGTPTQKQINNLERGLSSGWMASVYFTLLWSKHD